MEEDLDQIHQLSLLVWKRNLTFSQTTEYLGLTDFSDALWSRILRCQHREKVKKPLRPRWDPWTHLVGWYADDTCGSPLLPQLPLLDLAFSLPGAGSGAVLLLGLAVWRALLVYVVAGRGAGVRGPALSPLRLGRGFLRVAPRGCACMVRFLLQSGTGGGPSHRERGGQVVRGSVRAVGELGGRRRSSVAAAAVRVAGSQRGSRHRGNVPQHSGSHLLPFCLPLLQEIRGGVWLEPACGHGPFLTSCSSRWKLAKTFKVRLRS